MEEKEIIKRLNNSFKNCSPNNLDKILLECEEIKRKEIIMKNKEKKSGGWLKNLAFLSGGIACTLIGVFTVNYIGLNKIDSVISLDVNPSIELEVNKEEKVLKALPLNDEAAKILEDMDLKKTDMRVAVNAIIGSMVKNGYISEIANSILVSVENENKIKGEEIQNKVSNEISEILKGLNINGAVLSQTVETKTELEKTAEEYGITVGKAQLIEEIISKNHTLHYEDLAKMTINELNLIKDSKEVKTDKVKTTGTSSTKSYIGQAKAKDIALKHAGTSESKIYDYSIDFDSDGGILVYEIEFNTKNYEYEYDVNAKTGEIVKNEKSQNDDYNEDVLEGKVPSSITNSNTTTSKPSSSTSKPSNSTSSKPSSSTSSSSSLISRSKAKTIALNKAGVSSSQITDYEIELDTENGTKVYEISFNSGRNEYDIEINAKTGKILKYEKEIDD